MSKLIKGLDNLLTWMALAAREPASSFCELETVDFDKHSLVASDGSLMGVIELHGSARLVGNDEYHEIVNRLTATMGSFMRSAGHDIQFYWCRDPDGAKEQVRLALEPARAQARQLGLDFTDVLDEKEREITKWVSYESVYMAMWTHPGVLASTEAKVARAQQKAENKDFEKMNFLGAQNPKVMLSALRNRHSAFISSVMAELADVGLVATHLDAHEALRAIRMSVDPEWTPRDWKAVIPGDKIPKKFPMRDNEMSAVWWPPLGSQVWPRDAKVFGGRFVKIGDRLHAPMYVEIPPGDPDTFQRLISRTLGLDPKMPWSMSFLIGGAGDRKVAFKGTIASFLAVLNSDNPYIKEATKQLKVFAKSGAVVSLKICFNTWAPTGKEALLRERAARMAQAVIDWGGAEVREVTGDPVEGFTSTALGLTSRSIAAEAAAPLQDVVPMLPVTRPASPWRIGAQLFTSTDGKLMPYQPGSPVMTTWISLACGAPGTGKSVLMNMLHLATCLAPQPGVNKLPQIAIIDIGPSSSGLASMLKNALPPQHQHYVNHFRIRNIPEYAFNPFDPQLGMEGPLPEDRAALIDLLTMITTPAETGEPYEGTAELAGLVIDEMYDALRNNERGNPHRYHPGIDPKVDEAIQIYGIPIEEKVSWYEVRDLLFQAGAVHEAHLAQRYAVPVLSDAASAARSPAVRDIYGRKLTNGEGSESLPEAFSRMVQAACREYPILSLPTRFDIGESRVTILDLDEVAKGGGPAGQKQTSIMYALALYMLGRHYTMTKENLRDMPEAYRAHHFKRVQAMSSELKTICCDEFHRTSQKFSGALRERIKVYAREGRKWFIQLVLGSQRMADFDEELIDMATSIYIMERPDEGLVNAYTERFGLTPTEATALRDYIRGPRPGGGTFFARMKTKDGYFNQLLRNPAGPIELWAFATTAEDKAIREMVYNALGPVEGRMALALSYPGGSAKKDADARKEALVLQAGTLLDAAEGDLYQKIAKEVIDAYQKLRVQQITGEIDMQRAQQRSSSQTTGT